MHSHLLEEKIRSTKTSECRATTAVRPACEHSSHKSRTRKHTRLLPSVHLWSRYVLPARRARGGGSNTSESASPKSVRGLAAELSQTIPGVDEVVRHDDVVAGLQQEEHGVAADV